MFSIDSLCVNPLVPQTTSNVSSCNSSALARFVIASISNFIFDCTLAERALLSEEMTTEVNTAIMAMTTNSSTSVKADCAPVLILTQKVYHLHYFTADKKHPKGVFFVCLDVLSTTGKQGHHQAYLK